MEIIPDSSKAILISKSDAGKAKDKPTKNKDCGFESQPDIRDISDETSYSQVTKLLLVY